MIIQTLNYDFTHILNVLKNEYFTQTNRLTELKMEKKILYNTELKNTWNFKIKEVKSEITKLKADIETIKGLTNNTN